MLTLLESSPHLSSLPRDKARRLTGVCVAGDELSPHPGPPAPASDLSQPAEDRGYFGTQCLSSGWDICEGSGQRYALASNWKVLLDMRLIGRSWKALASPLPSLQSVAAAASRLPSCQAHSFCS